MMRTPDSVLNSKPQQYIKFLIHKNLIMRLFFTIMLWSIVMDRTWSQPITHSTATSQFHRVLREKTFISEKESLEDFARRRLSEITENEGVLSLRPIHEDRSGYEQLVSGLNKPESELSAALNPLDSMNLVVAGMTLENNNIFDPVKIPIYYSLDGGSSWQRGNFKPNPFPALSVVIGGGGDPVLAFDKNGHLWIAWIIVYVRLGDSPPGRVSLFMARSTNKGATWGDPVEVAQSAFQADLAGSYTGEIIDKEWLASDQSSGIFAGNQYLAYSLTRKDAASESMTIKVKTRKNGAPLFDDGITVPDKPYKFVHFPTIETDQQGNVHLLFCAGDDSTGVLGLFHALSEDGGASFQPEHKITNIYFRGIATGAWNSIQGIDPARQYPCPQMKIADDNTIFVSWTSSGSNANDTLDGHDIYLTRSTNQGKNWFEPVKVSTGSARDIEQYYSTLCIPRKDQVAVAYYDRSEINQTGLGTLTNYVLSVSNDGGQTFLPPVTLNNTPTDFAQFTLLSNPFGIGEYNQILCTSGKIIPFWADGRKKNGDLDIYMASIPFYTTSSNDVLLQTLDWRFSVRAPYPNPSFGEITLEVTLEQASSIAIVYISADGKQIISQSPSTKQYGIGTHKFTQTLPPGIWFCSVETAWGKHIMKVLKE